MFSLMVFMQVVQRCLHEHSCRFSKMVNTGRLFKDDLHKGILSTAVVQEGFFLDGLLKGYHAGCLRRLFMRVVHGGFS